ncbi:MAG TPA: hypothetical protein PLE16_00780 [Spirochaetota bacterium]|jgi:hypothetical protein|nr:hypothetical protein [Spirochaetota bacterium]HPW50979.1 hypothetical protein [Spirochaetota bacterium]HPY02578.1 hypothetical protein [Spirochaetota bacterium]HQA52687.1 hypothetical protein [Spirochaetota bacterium]
MYFNLVSLLFVLVVYGLTIISGKISRFAFARSVKISFLAVFSISLLYLVNVLSDISNIEKLAEGLHFVLLANAYSGILRIMILFYSEVKRKNSKNA